MSYAEHRRIIDTDSHLMELDTFLLDATREEHKGKVPTIFDQKDLPVTQEMFDHARALFEKRQNNPDTMAKFEASLLDNRKFGLTRLGAFDQQERSQVVDMFGFEIQWILPTFSFHQVAHLQDPDALEVGAMTLNKAMGDFCSKDQRLKATGYLPLRLGAERALKLLKQGFDDGCYSFMVDTNQPNDKAYSFTHPAYDPIWAEFEKRGIPVALHVAANGDYKPVSPSFTNNGKAEVTVGGDAPVGELGLFTIGSSAQIFLAAMVFDGIFERHPKLTVISMEHGATWLPSWLRQLDFTAGMLKRFRKFAELPSETAKKHIKVSPFSGEPVGWIIENSSPDMLVFASDYPHPEGGPDPIKRFEATMENCDDATMDKFYYGNMCDAMGLQA